MSQKQKGHMQLTLWSFTVIWCNDDVRIAAEIIELACLVCPNIEQVCRAVSCGSVVGGSALPSDQRGGGGGGGRALFNCGKLISGCSRDNVPVLEM